MGDTHNQGFDHTEPKTAWIAAFGASSVIGLILVIVGIQYYFERSAEQQIYMQVLEPVAEDLTNLRDREDLDLYQDKYTDRASGAVRISIERAMSLIEKEYAAGSVKYPTRPTPVKAIE